MKFYRMADMDNLAIDVDRDIQSLEPLYIEQAKYKKQDDENRKAFLDILFPNHKKKNCRKKW